METNQTFLDSDQAAEYLGLKRSTLEAWRCRGGGPKFVKMGRLVKYRFIDLENFVERQMRDHTSGWKT
jgi:excisionase family DNA binding protein